MDLWSLTSGWSVSLAFLLKVLERCRCRSGRLCLVSSDAGPTAVAVCGSGLLAAEEHSRTGLLLLVLVQGDKEEP